MTSAEIVIDGAYSDPQTKYCVPKSALSGVFSIPPFSMKTWFFC